MASKPKYVQRLSGGHLVDDLTGKLVPPGREINLTEGRCEYLEGMNKVYRPDEPPPTSKAGKTNRRRKRQGLNPIPVETPDAPDAEEVKV
jgi:hypothetical protein